MVWTVQWDGRIMHTYLLTRGIKHEVDQFITELQGKYLPFKWRNVNDKDSKIQDTMVQLGVRPIQLWELVYPEESRDVIMMTLFKQPAKKGERTAGMTQHKKHLPRLGKQRKQCLSDVKVLRWFI